MSTANTDYLSVYGQAKDMYLPVSPVTGRLLYMLARAARYLSVPFGGDVELSIRLL